MQKNRGFTLIELMIVVAIIGILAAIAIPNFIRYQLRSRSAELPTNVTAIKTAAIATNGVIGSYLAADESPTGCASGVAVASDAKCDWARPFDADADDDNQLGFSGLGWIPEGPVYGAYEVDVGCANGPKFFCFTAEARADIDADGNDQVVQYAKPNTDQTDDAGSPNGMGMPCNQPDGEAGAWESVNKCGEGALY